jgi:hypothetical protein
MRLARLLLAVVLVGLVALPLVLRRTPESQAGGEARQLIIITPHLAQLREEFAEGFADWHEQTYGQPVTVRFISPGGTSEIIKQLSAQYRTLWNEGRIDPQTLTAERGAMPIDLMFGGGSYDHGRLMTDLRLSHDGQDITLPMSVPAGFSQQQLDDWFGENRIGAQPLYDQRQHWLATAVSSFGIVYNRDMYRGLQMPEPASFRDLTDPRLANSLALADPRQSGSITTTLDYILSSEGWDAGWRLLRELSANARYFSASSAKPPIDVSSGEAAAGLAIDFYGRGQAQSVLRPGEDPDQGRVGYLDPAGSVYVDPDPVSILSGGPEPELARRFVEFVLSEQGQSIWNFPPRVQGETLGPQRYALRRLPVRRVMYERYLDRMMDRVDPYLMAGAAEPAGWRSAIGPVMGAFGIDSAHELKQAWAALHRARADAEFPQDVLAAMESAFYALPPHEMPDGAWLDFTADHYRAIRGSWRDPPWARRSQQAYTEFFRARYRDVVTMYQRRGLMTAAAGADR